MATLCGVVVEDDPDLLEFLARALVPLVVGCEEVIACESIAELEHTHPSEGSLVVLVTDGYLPDGTCEEVIEYVLTAFGARRLCGHALLSSGNPEGHWAGAFSRARAGGVMLSYVPKPVSIGDLETWWKAVNRNFI